MPERNHAPIDDVHATRVSAVALVVLGVIALVLAVAYLLIAAWNAAANGANAPPDARPAAPMLESAPQIDRAQYAAEKEELLQSYGWVDRQDGIARIPIERAMALLAARGNMPRAGGAR